MGSTQAHGMAEAMGDGMVTLEQALSYHLTANHYPPVGFMLESVKAAVVLVAEGNEEETVDLREVGVEHRLYGFDVPARVLVEGYHAEPFVAALMADDDDNNEEE